jgi:DNA-binding transcriptional regulator YiaG
MKNKYEKECHHCGGKGKIEITVFFPVSKMVKIMKKHKLSQLKLSEILEISQAGVNNWMKPNSNVKGIKKKYFDMLAKKGFS